MFTRRRFRTGRIKRSAGEPLTLLNTGRQLDAMDCAVLFVFLPGGTCAVAADDSFDGEDLQFPDLHASPLVDSLLGLGDLVGEAEGEEMRSQRRELLGQIVEPEGRKDGEYDAFLLDGLCLEISFDGKFLYALLRFCAFCCVCDSSNCTDKQEKIGESKQQQGHVDHPHRIHDYIEG